MHLHLSEPLTPACGKLGFRGTQFEKHSHTIKPEAINSTYCKTKYD